MPIILDGKKLSEEILEDLKGRIKKGGKRLKLAAILVGDDQNSKIFLRQKERACQKIGIDFELFQFPENINRENLIKEVENIIRQENNGIIIQLPLPEHIDSQEILNLIPPEKDADLLSEKSRGSKLLAPVLAGILELFKKYKIEFKGKNVAVVGMGRLVGRPVAEWLEKNGAKVFAVDKETPEISRITQEADIIIAGAGKPGLITGNMVKKSAVVVDAAGDVDFNSVSQKASYLTPVLGGVGPMTVAMLLKNLLLLNL